LAGLRPIGALDPWPNLRVLGFTSLLSVATGLLFGLAPALHATRVELAPSLRERSRGVVGARRRRLSLGKSLVVAQLALSLVLLTGAGLFLRTLRNLQRVDLGYSPEGMLMLELDPVVAGYQGERVGAFVESIVGRLRALPGVDGVAASENGLFSGTESRTTVSIAGRPPLGDDEDDVAYDRVAGGYFDVVGIPVVRGRGIAASDRAGSPPVAVINEAMAAAYFAAVDPIGQRFSERDVPDVVYEVVGVCGDARDHDLREPMLPRYYAPMLQSAASLSAFNVEIRTARPSDLVGPVRTAVAALDPKVAILDLTPLPETLAGLLRFDALVAKLASAFGLLALCLAAIGLYGVVSYGVARRINEIGIRMVLGADGRRVLWMVVRETMTLVGVGVAIGASVALVAARAVSGQLFGVSGRDLPTLLGATAALAAIALAAGLIPGSRAVRVDPGEALRQE
jgi:predicted permease